MNLNQVTLPATDFESSLPVSRWRQSQESTVARTRLADVKKRDQRRCNGMDPITLPKGP